ncbi:MAG: sulfotransferase domain-containing protein [Flavobacteriales bacterium]|nr:sulfotransferase domain-containing protein [Flavobacteriales bacterium]
MKIFITGAPKTGTTLLARMFNYFDCKVINEEGNMHDFHKQKDNGIYVCKRSENSLFSGAIPADPISKQLEWAKDFKIINVVRDGRDVIHSIYREWGVINPYIWINSIQSALKYESYIDLTVKYEDLITHHDLIQRKISQTFGLKKTGSFSDYPKNIPDDCFKTDKPHYKPRKLEARETNRNFYKTIGLDPKFILDLNEELGY